MIKHIPLLILLISDAFLGQNIYHPHIHPPPNIVAAANISIVVPQTEFCFICFKWFSNVVGGSIVETRGLNISGLIYSNFIRRLRKHAWSSDLPVVCLTKALKRQFPSPKILSTFRLVSRRNGSN